MEVQAIEGVHEVGVGALEGLGDEDSIRTYIWLSDNVRSELADQSLVPNTGIVSLRSLSAGGWTCLSWAGTPM